MGCFPLFEIPYISTVLVVILLPKPKKIMVSSILQLQSKHVEFQEIDHGPTIWKVIIKVMYAVLISFCKSPCFPTIYTARHIHSFKKLDSIIFLNCIIFFPQLFRLFH